MHASSLPQLAALLALGYGAAFAFDLEEWSFGVAAGGSSVSFDARFADERWLSAGWGERRCGGTSGYQANFLSLM